MPSDLSLQDAQRALLNIIIPPRPKILSDLAVELGNDEPDIRTVANRITHDVGLSVAVLKTVNSPFFGCRAKTGSVSHAVQMLGLKSIANIVTGASLRGALGGKQAALAQFWNDAEQVASLAAYVAAQLPGVSREECYAFGMFRDCGIILMQERFDDYRETLRLVESSNRPMTQIEEGRHGTNHALVGRLMAKAWFLPEAICEGILLHHELEVFDAGQNVSADARTLVAINYVAEALNDPAGVMHHDVQSVAFLDRSLSHLGLGTTEYDDMKDETVAIAS